MILRKLLFKREVEILLRIFFCDLLHFLISRLKFNSYSVRNLCSSLQKLLQMFVVKKMQRIELLFSFIPCITFSSKLLFQR